MKKSLSFLSLLALCALPLAVKAEETPASSRVGPPTDIAEMVRLEAERSAIRRTLIAEIKAAEKQAAEAPKTPQGREAVAAINAESIRKQKAQSARLQEIHARLQVLKPETKATQPEQVR